MSSEAYPGGSGTGCGQRTVLTSPVPGVVAGLPVAIAIFNFWNAGTTSRRHAE
jgi:hypothetical protein